MNACEIIILEQYTRDFTRGERCVQAGMLLSRSLAIKLQFCLLNGDRFPNMVSL